MSTKTRNKSKSEPDAALKSTSRTCQDGPKGPTLSTPSLDPLESTENDSQPPAWVSVFRAQLAEDIEEKFNTRLDAFSMTWAFAYQVLKNM